MIDFVMKTWWHYRRESWSAAFICHDVNRHSLAEFGNSIMTRKGIVKNSLDQTVSFLDLTLASQIPQGAGMQVFLLILEFYLKIPP